MSGIHWKTHLPFIIQDLNLTRITEFDHGTNRDIKLTACSKVQPDIVPLLDNQSNNLIFKQSLEKIHNWLQKQTKNFIGKIE